jgi:hypothetical protein
MVMPLIHRKGSIAGAIFLLIVIRVRNEQTLSLLMKLKIQNSEQVCERHEDIKLQM